MYRLIKPLLRDTTKSKIEIYASTSGAIERMKNDLKTYLGDDVRLYYDLLDEDDRQKLVETMDEGVNFDNFGNHSVLETQLYDLS